MATNIGRKVAYGFTEPLLQVGLEPIVTRRNPTTADKAPIGTEWVNTAAQDVFFLASLEDGIAVWIPITNSGVTLDFDTDSGTATPAGDTIEILGGTNIATTGAGNTVTVNIDGSIGVANGGTGVSSFTPYAVITGGTTGTGALQNVSGVGTSGQVLTSNGAAALPTWQAAAAGTVTSVSGGNNITITGTAVAPIVNVSGTTNHAVQVGNAGGSLTSVAVGTTNTVLLGNTGADPSWGTVPNASLSNSSITLTNGQNITVTGSPVSLGGAATIALSGVVPIANGGTNASSMATTDGVVYFDGTRLVTTSAGTAGEVLTSNGAGVAPTYQAAAGSGIVTINGNSGSVTGAAVTLTTGAANANGTTLFTGSGATMTMTFDTFGGGTNNLGIGSGVFSDGAFSGAGNTAVGAQAGNSITSGGTNCLFGAYSGSFITNGESNCLFGYEGGRGSGITTGDNNIVINGGSNYAGNESNNIIMNHAGIAAESNVLRIGSDTGTGGSEINAAYVSGIDGITVTGTAVLVASDNQLGIAVSSKRFKNDIEDMGQASNLIYKLRPVTFTWNQKSAPGLANASQERQYGLIAEEVAEVLPQIVGFDKKGAPRNVNYGDLASLLLNEIQKLNARVAALEAVLALPKTT